MEKASVLLIIIIGILSYSNTFNIPFQFDDGRSIVENPGIKNYSFQLSDVLKTRFVGFLTFVLNYKLNGLNVIGYHILNLTIHILNAILVYRLVMLTLRVLKYQRVKVSKYQSSEDSDTMTLGHSDTHLIALFSALLFVSHPIQTQAVTYIVQRFASLATFFYLLSLVMYIKFRIHDTKKMHDAGYTIHDKENHTSCIMNRESCIVSHASCIMYLASLFSAVLAMKTKEIAFTLPIIIVLYEFMFFNRSRVTSHESRVTDHVSRITCHVSWIKRILYLFPFLLTVLVIPLSFIGIDKPAGDMIGEIREASQETGAIPRWSYLFTQFRVIATYVRLLFFPINQNLDYDYPAYHSFFSPNVFLSFMLLLSIFGLGVYLFYRSRCTIHDSRFTIHDTRITHHVSRLIAFGILWFFITLSVESSIIPIADVINEHRMYLPSVGVVIAFGTALFGVIQRRGGSATVRQNDRTSGQSSSFSFLSIALPLYCSVALIVLLSIAAYHRNTVWQGEISLWEDVIRKSTNNARGYHNLGNIYLNKGETDKAIEYLRTALRLKPDSVESHNNLGNAYAAKGWNDIAIEHLGTAIMLKPDFAAAYYNIGIVYAAKGLFDISIDQYKIALRLKPDYADAYYNLGNAYVAKGLVDEAIESYRNTIKLNPNHPNAHNNLGGVYETKGLVNDAICEYQTALRLKPDYETARNNLNRILGLKSFL